jgi:ABC-2 type transport system permease protein
MKAYKALVFREVKRFLNVYNQTLIAPIISAFLYFTIFTVIFAHKDTANFDYKLFVVSGIVMMSVLQNAYSNTQSTMTTAKVLGFSVDMTLPPISSFTLLLAFLTGGILRGLSIGVISLITFSFFVKMTFHSVFVIILYLILASALFALFGIIVGAISKNFDSAISYNTYFIMPITFLSGTFYSVKMLSPFWQKVILFNPVFYIIDGFRFGFLGVTESRFGAILPIFGLIFCILLIGFIAHYFLENKYRNDER